MRSRLISCCAAAAVALFAVQLVGMSDASAQCSVGTPVSEGCGDLGYEGCCAADGSLQWCEGGWICTLPCQDNDPPNNTCGWQDTQGYYDCGQTGEDPSGAFPIDCATCDPECQTGFKCVGTECVACGDGECGGTCGDCPQGDVCVAGMCCTPQCDGKNCGDDGCQGTCGACTEAQFCDDTQNCQDCDCGNKQCGMDQCGNSCGDCSESQFCDPDFQCKDCDCGNKQCGEDECGTSCGTCAEDTYCDQDFLCAACTCDQKECGGDGCGTPCGTCTGGKGCLFGMCTDVVPDGCTSKDTAGCPGCACEACVCAMDSFCCTSQWDNICAGECGECGGGCPCMPFCDGIECGDDGCDGTCGSCTDPAICYLGTCCTADCTDKTCGGDGCGGECGLCGDAQYCDDTQNCQDCSCGDKECGADQCGNPCGECADGYLCNDQGKCEECIPECTDKDCGDDGCGGSCGTCPDGKSCSAEGKCLGDYPEKCLGANEPSASTCPDGLSYEGCCDGDGRVVWCDQGLLFCIDCLNLSPSCGWDAQYYNCGTDGSADPSGANPIDCAFGAECDPPCGDGFKCEFGQCVACTCDGKTCGDDGCGNSCGTCPDGFECVAGNCEVAGCGNVTFEGCCDGTVLKYCENDAVSELDCSTLDPPSECGWDDSGPYYNCGFTGADPSGTNPIECPTPPCLPKCAGKDCGDDGCGGTCGDCAADETCSAAGKCEKNCTADCTGKNCGDDGCGGSCGDCAADETCSAAGSCEKVCTPDCTGKQCGDDGCGGQCPPGCGGIGSQCVNGTCQAVVPPDKTDKDAAGGTDANASADTSKDGGSSSKCSAGFGPSEGALPFGLLLAGLAMALAWRRRRA